jgi:hypothetical protein
LIRPAGNRDPGHCCILPVVKTVRRRQRKGRQRLGSERKCQGPSALTVCLSSVSAASIGSIRAL